MFQSLVEGKKITDRTLRLNIRYYHKHGASLSASVHKPTNTHWLRAAPRSVSLADVDGVSL